MKKTELFNNIYLYLSIFTAGAAALTLEILGTRIPAPFYGSTIFVWSSLISITLFSLSIGYVLGSIAADCSMNPRLFSWFFLRPDFQKEIDEKDRTF